MEEFVRREGTYLVSCDQTKLDLDVIHGFLSSSYWSPGITREQVEKAMQNSLCFGLYDLKLQIGFARVLTDYVHSALLADVFVLEPHRGKGLGKYLVESILQHPKLQGLRCWNLVTKDAHGFYAKLGFRPHPHPERFMEKGKQSF